MKKLFAILMSIMMIACFMPTMAFAAAVTVTVTVGDDAHITHDNQSGALTQNVDGKEITAIVCNAAEGYYFPEDYASKVTDTKDLTVTRETAGQIKISGIPSAEVMITLPAAEAKQREQTPSSVAFEATGANTGKLKNLTAGLEYQIDSGEAQPITLESGKTELELPNLSACTISVIKKGGETTLDSVAHTIQVTKAEAPKGIQKIDCSDNGKKDGKITGVSNTMEYRKKTDSTPETWEPINANEVTGLAAGTYAVRVKANGQELASEAAEVTITEPEAKSTIPDAVMDAIKGNTVEYNGTPQAAVTVDKVKTADFTVKYKVKNAEDGTYTTEIPTVTNVADTKTITVKVSKEGFQDTTKDVNVTVNAKTVTVKPFKVQDKDYDGNNTATLAQGTTLELDGVIGEENVQVDTDGAQVAFADQNAAKDKTVTYTGLNLKGTDAANYALSNKPVTTTANINPKELSISGVSFAERKYTGNGNLEDVVTTVTFTGTVASETLLKETDYAVKAATITGDDFTVGEKATSVTVELKESVSNYILPNGVYTEAKIQIQPAEYTYTVGKTQAVKKGSPLSAINVAPEGGIGVCDDAVKGEIKWYTEAAHNTQATDTAFNTEEPKVTLYWVFTPASSNSWENNTNYVATEKSGSTEFTIGTKTEVSALIEVMGVENKIYDGKPVKFDGSATVLDHEDEKIPLTYELHKDTENGATVQEAVNVGKYVLKITVAENTNYTGNKTVEFTIFKKPVTVQPESFTIKQGDTLPTLVLEYVGLIGEDKLTGDEAYKPEFKYMQDDKEVADPKEAGVYTIKWTNENGANFTNDNYRVEKKDTATLTIEKKTPPASGGSYYPYTPSTPSKPAAPNLDKTKTDSTTAINAAATANKYDAAEQAEVKKILDKANADIKNAKTEAEVKAIEEAAQAEIDKILTTEEKATVAALDNVEKRDFETKSKVITRKSGKKVIRLTWTAPDGVDVDGYEIFRSTKKNSGFGTKPYFETTNTSYTNTKNLKPGKIYYYKVRAFVVINGERVYTDYSMKAFRTIK